MLREGVGVGVAVSPLVLREEGSLGTGSAGAFPASEEKNKMKEIHMHTHTHTHARTPTHTVLSPLIAEHRPSFFFHSSASCRSSCSSSSERGYRAVGVALDSPVLVSAVFSLFAVLRLRGVSRDLLVVNILRACSIRHSASLLHVSNTIEGVV